MKTVTFKISMPDELAAFVKGEKEAGRHATYSELFREWVRDRRQRRAEETARWLETQMRDAPEGDFTDGQLQRVIREGREFHRKRRK
ncbi:MAG: hypothetical protein HYY24_20585 [Verrucomicrobia bacterium]|nr:hypothetical protein [Verrucomicrobiota bacterium]